MQPQFSEAPLRALALVSQLLWRGTPAEKTQVLGSRAPSEFLEALVGVVGGSQIWWIGSGDGQLVLLQMAAALSADFAALDTAGDARGTLVDVVSKAVKSLFRIQRALPRANEPVNPADRREELLEVNTDSS